MIRWWLFIKRNLGGRPKGRKDDYPRVRGVDKLRKDPKAYKAIKKYKELESEYHRLKMLKNTYGKGTRSRLFMIEAMRKTRLKQADLYEIIAENYLVGKLAKELGIGITMPYRRYLVSKKRGTRWRHKNK